MEHLDILYMCDENFADIAGVSMTSLFENNPADKIRLDVYLFMVGVSRENQARFTKLAEDNNQTIHLIDARATYEEICQLELATYRGSSMTNLRLYFDRLVPKTVHRMLYLDCDTIICDELTEMATYDLRGKMLGMVLDAYGKLVCERKYRKFPYYNAGVILMDCDRWRDEHWHDYIKKYIEQKGAELLHPDQDVYNVVCGKEIACLPVRYNLQTVHRMYTARQYFGCFTKKGYYPAEELEVAREHPAVVHMIRTLGANPWNEDSMHPDKELFERIKADSLWNFSEERSFEPDFFIRVERGLYAALPKIVFFPISLVAIRMLAKRKQY